MKRKLAIAAVLVCVVVAAVLGFLYDKTLPARLLSWLPGQPDQFTVPSGVAEQFKRILDEPRQEPREMGTSLRVLFVGDTSFGESYQGQSFFDAKGYDYCLERLVPLLRCTDLAVANLETPLTSLAESPLEGKKMYLHWSDVQKAPAALKRHNIRFVSLANNHALDYGARGLLQTLKALYKNGIAWLGAGLNEFQASKPLRMNPCSEKGGIGTVKPDVVVCP